MPSFAHHPSITEEQEAEDEEEEEEEEEVEAAAAASTSLSCSMPAIQSPSNEPFSRTNSLRLLPPLPLLGAPEAESLRPAGAGAAPAGPGGVAVAAEEEGGEVLLVPP